MPTPATPDQPFAAWLLRQDARPDDIGDLARTARRDPAFPRLGTYEEVERHLVPRSEDGSARATAEAARYEWRGGTPWTRGDGL
jgi:hypothetical protein